MLKKYITLSIFLIFTISYGQKYSNKGIEYYVNVLSKKVTDSSFTDHSTGNLLKTPKVEYWVYDNTTSHIVSENPDYSDNKEYSIFQKIYKKGKTSDFMIMAENENPSIRFYGFWALVKNRKYKKAKLILKKENEYSGKVYWNSLGCDIEPIEITVLMNKLLDRMKKYGN